MKISDLVGQSESGTMRPYAKCTPAQRERHRASIRATLVLGIQQRPCPGKRWVTLEVPGRKSGKPTRFPLGIATVDGQSYLGSMLGNKCNWVRNVRANDGYAVIDRRGRRRVRLTEVPTELRPGCLRHTYNKCPAPARTFQ